MPIQYRVDPGPMSVNPSGVVVVNNQTGLGRVQSLFGNWSGVATASLSFSYAGVLLPTGAYTGGPVASGSNSLANFNALMQSCDDGQQSPVIFDPNGEMLAQLGLSADIIGVTFPCDLDSSSGHVKAAGIVLNGQFIDGVSYPGFSANDFNQAITHEMGHFSGLDHSQINVEVLNERGSCSSSEIAGLPVMFPELACLSSRVDAGFPVLSPDDTAWISRLYPVTSTLGGKTLTSSAYGTISGAVYFSDGVTQAQGVNVIARSVSNPQGTAFSVVSGYLFTGALGQNLTCTIELNACPSSAVPTGSHDTRLVGSFDIPVTPGTYTLSVESINSNFVGGSGVGPLSRPISMPGSAPASQQVSVSAGGSVTINIVLIGTPPRFDSFETSELRPEDRLMVRQSNDRAMLLAAPR